MKQVCCVLFACMALMPFAAVGQDKAPEKRIIVWTLQAKTGVTQSDIDSISGYIAAEVQKVSDADIVSEADINTVLQGEEAKQRCGVDDGDTGCIAEIGNALGVPEAVSGDLGRMGDYWILNLRRVDLRRVAIKNRISRQIKGNTNALVEAVPEAVAALFGAQPAPPAVVVAEKTGDEAGMSTLNVAGFNTFFIGVGLVAFGGIATWQAQVATDDANNERFNNSDSGAAEDRRDGWKAGAITSYVLGGALVTTGIILWIVDALQKPDEEPALQVSAGFDGNGVSGAVMWRW